MLMRERLGIGGLKHPGYNDAGSAISIGGSLLGGMMGDDAAGDATDAFNKGAGISKAMLEKQQKANDAAYRGYRDIGTGANNLLSYYLGITGPEGESRSSIYNRLLPEYTLKNMGIVDPANTNGIADIELEKAVNAEYSNRWRPNDGGAGYGSLMKGFTQDDLNKDVVYNNGLQFGLDQGNQAISRLAASQGGLNSGSALKALTRYANDYGTTKAEGAYNRFYNSKNNVYGMLSGQQNVGLNATNNNLGLNNQLVTANANTALQQGQNAGNAAVVSGANWANSINNGIGNTLASWYLKG